MPVSSLPEKNTKKLAQEYRAYLDFSALFGNDNPVYLELGCGLGGFAIEHAERYPQINFIGVEKTGNVLITALERAKEKNLPNLRFLCVPAETLECFFPEGSVKKIFLNFSTPLPETSRERQRLTAPRFLRIYRKILSGGGEIVQKTDSAAFFEYSLCRFSEEGFSFRDVSLDLHNSAFAEENIVTEYERKFSSMGKPIYRLTAVKSGERV